VDNVVAKLQAVGSPYEVPPAIVAELATRTIEYKERLAAARAPETMGRLATLLKNESKDLLLNVAKRVAGIVRVQPLSEAQRFEIGIPARKRPEPSPTPSRSPRLHLTVKGKRVFASLVGAAPDGAIGASLFSFVGPTASTDIAAWQYQGNLGRQPAAVEFGDDVPNFATVFFTAFYFNGRKESGVAATPVEVTLGKASVANEAMPALKTAA
jgi:hypothetical protein